MAANTIRKRYLWVFKTQNATEAKQLLRACTLLSIWARLLDNGETTFVQVQHNNGIKLAELSAAWGLMPVLKDPEWFPNQKLDKDKWDYFLRKSIPQSETIAFMKANNIPKRLWGF